MRRPSLWVMVQRHGDQEGWACTVCNLDPEPPALAGRAEIGTWVLAIRLVAEIRGSWIDAGDGEGYRRWGCDASGWFRPGMNEVRLLEVPGPEGREWKGRGWVGKLVEME